MPVQVINTDKAPAAIGPYSQAIDTGSLIFTSGQLPISLATGQMPGGAAAQARECMNNVKAILEAAGTSLAQVVKVTIFLQDMGDFAAVNEVYQSFFTAPYPARSCVQVAKLPKDALVEIESVALK